MQLQCDISVMFSNDICKEFEVAELEECSSFLQHAIYHMDGMEQLRHMEMITDISRINMIQWVQVAGQPSISKFWPQLIFQKNRYIKNFQDECLVVRRKNETDIIW